VETLYRPGLRDRRTGCRAETCRAVGGWSYAAVNHGCCRETWTLLWRNALRWNRVRLVIARS
jgi:hypothetical protein